MIVRKCTGVHEGWHDTKEEKNQQYSHLAAWTTTLASSDVNSRIIRVGVETMESIQETATVALQAASVTTGQGIWHHQDHRYLAHS
ncbi:hypothetical protein SISSUDRAFT_1050443 [Sistotremastrum suecicum HHB10207 ss-3]|uniref:Uncharacterized protein n=1 Tax=Sistotremastrum suecicum HHB10207 ss-3 TaxID=1314776 RepID=A0A166B7C5_9AGAM|nr:hypothetical protein SISSUDRAFT_1050443 [Sistotremastrum suecicum HHB10207 ss-3]